MGTARQRRRVHRFIGIMARALFSQYAATGDPDTALNLAVGSSQITTTLAAELSEDEHDKVILTDGGLAEPKGTLAIEDEIIYYHVYDRKEPGCMLDLLRGQEGTAPATHANGTDVLILGRARFVNPAVKDSIMSMQDKLAELEARIVALEP
jgi:hypothetical protein